MCVAFESENLAIDENVYFVFSIVDSSSPSGHGIY